MRQKLAIAVIAGVLLTGVMLSIVTGYELAPLIRDVNWPPSLADVSRIRSFMRQFGLDREL